MDTKRESIRLMGTIIDLVIEHPSADAVMAEVIHRLREYEHRFSANSPDSELMAVNKQAGIKPVKVHPELYHLIEVGKHHSCAPDSNLNIAIGPLVQTWRIGFKDAKVPTSEEIDRLLQKTNPQKIRLDDEEQSVYLEDTGMSIDLGSLAKGYIADLIVAYLKSEGVESALLNLGGNILGLGPPKDRKKNHWTIGIQHPLSPRSHYVAALKVADQSVVTSGIYERSLEKEGRTYHHILDPHTGYPTSTDVASLTIHSKRSVDGEIWTTRLYGKTSEEVIDALNRLEGIEGLVLTKDGQMLYSKGLEENIIK